VRQVLDVHLDLASVADAAHRGHQAQRLVRLDYLGLEGGDAYVSGNPTGGQIVFRMSAEHWLTVDQSKVYG
jgi:hypothetical protein